MTIVEYAYEYCMHSAEQAVLGKRSGAPYKIKIATSLN